MMPLATGIKIGPYGIVSPLGAGGMGEVYRATDTNLGRQVALKVLPPAFAKDTDRMARFKREAQVLASLNHRNIAAIYGVEGSAIVMELVEGEDLAGPLPLEESLPIAKQIAEALEAAHEKGIVHRDLKPANVKITPEGVVKLLSVRYPDQAVRHIRCRPGWQAVPDYLAAGTGEDRDHDGGRQLAKRDAAAVAI
jgi:aminoglycoside phosphotransferase (APT) family kinase protein